MFPTLYSAGSITVSSFGFFLSLAFLFSIFLVWRLARAWDLNEEKILDLCLLTFFGTLLGARVLFVLLHLNLFADNLLGSFTKIVLLTKYPGLEFWGGILGGSLTLYFFAKRMRKIDFWQVADLAVVGLLGGLILGNIGCLLGGCNIGVRSDLPFAVSMVGFVGKRFPVQALEVIIFTFVLWRIWPMAVKFHFTGKIAALGLIILGSLEFFLEFLRAEKTGGFIFSPIIFSLGIFTFYKFGKRDIRLDFNMIKNFLIGLLTKSSVRGNVRKWFLKSWYNQKVNFVWSLHRIKKKLLLIRRRARVKKLPEHF